MAETKKAPVRCLYDVWDEDGTRHVAGTVADLPLPLVKALLADKKVERADPLPGEE